MVLKSWLNLKVLRLRQNQCHAVEFIQDKVIEELQTALINTGANVEIGESGKFPVLALSAKL